MTARHDAARVFITSNVVLSLSDNIMYTLAAIYHITFFGMGPLQLVLIGTAYQATVFLCEIPTGVIADLYSRRVSVIIGIFVHGLACLLIGLIPWLARNVLPPAFPLFSLLMFGEALRGLGSTFISGAQEAWATDEIGERNTSPVFLRSSQLAQIAGLAGMGLSIALSSFSLHLPFLVGALVQVALGFYLINAMREENFKPTPRQGSMWGGAMTSTLKEGIMAIRGKQVLVLLMIATFFAGAASEGFDRLWEAHFITVITLPLIGSLQAVSWFGMMNIAAKLLTIGALGWARRSLKTGTDTLVSRYLLLLSAMHLLLMVCFGLAPSFVIALTAFLCISIVTSLKRPLLSVWINRNVESQVRATVLSLGSQIDAIGQVAGGPGLGIIGATSSLRTVMLLVATLLTPTLGAYGRAAQQARLQEADAASD